MLVSVIDDCTLLVDVSVIMLLVFSVGFELCLSIVSSLYLWMIMHRFILLVKEVSVLRSDGFNAVLLYFVLQFDEGFTFSIHYQS